MKVSHYFEFEDKVTGGIKRSVEHQRKALEKKGIDYTTEPDMECDLLHLNVMGPKSVYYALKAYQKNVPVVIHTHNTHQEMEGSFRWLGLLERPVKMWLKRAYKLGDVLICPSGYNRNIVESYAPETEKTVLTNGVDLERLEGYGELREEYLEKYGLEPPVVFCVGHVMKRKGLRTFVETAEKMPELDFVWFGYLDRKLKDSETIELVDNSPDNCKFTGYIDDIRGGFGAGDIFFFPTKEDNEGIALLEAFSTGSPAVLRDIDVFNKFEDRRTCLKFEEDPENAIWELAENKELRTKLGENARRRMKEDFSLENVASELKTIYHSLISR